MTVALDPGVLDEVLAGLGASPRTLPAKLFYDEEGCRLFAAITELPEYYLTRTEHALLAAEAGAIAAALPAHASVVEYGASSEDKALLLLDALAATGAAARCYVPIDIATPALTALTARLAARWPSLTVAPIAADFLAPIALPTAAPLPRVGFFPGSTIGNLEPAAARAFLARASATLGRAARFLIGVDLRKDPARLLAAYDDAAGVTAAFNRNLLVRLNREAGADFDPAQFAHEARWNAAEGRIELHLVSRRAQRVRLANITLTFSEGDSIHTENCYKHSVQGFVALASAAGWQARRVWTDADATFALHLLATGGADESNLASPGIG